MDVPDESSPGADDNNAMEADLLAEVWNSYDDPDDHVRGKSEAEKQLELIVIGSESNFEEALNRGRRENVFLEDSGIAEAEIPKARWEDPDDEDNIVQVGKQRRYKRLRAPDEKVINGETLSKRLRDEFEKNLPAPVWATQKPAADENAFGLLGTSTESYIDRKSDRLPIQNFGFKRVTNLNFENPAKGIVHAVQFHPSAQIAMTASFGRTATIFQVDGKSNPKLKSVFFERFPISGAGFLSGGNEVLVCSKIHAHMHYFDLLSEKNVKIPWSKALGDGGFKRFAVSPDFQTVAFQGRGGQIHVFSGRSKEWMYTVKMNGSVEGLAFTEDSTQLLSIGDLGKVYFWDLKTRKCSHTFMDDGCVSGTTIALSPDNSFVAVGSNTGVVNVYRRRDCVVSNAPKPVKTVLNLTTGITSLKFNTTSELLALASNYVHGAVKLFHLNERQVVPNFPELNHKVRQAECIDFSLNSGFMAIGNNNGEALLYRLNHYKGF